MSAKAFYFLYLDLGLGREFLALELCIAKIGFHLNILPPEINLMIWNHYHKPLSHTQRNTILSLLESFREKESDFMQYCIQNMLKSLTSPHECINLDTFSMYAESIWNILHKRSLRGTLMTVGLFTFLTQRRVVISMLKWKIIGADLLIDGYTDDSLVMKTALMSNPHLLSKASSRIRDDETLLLDIMTECYDPSFLFSDMSERLRNKKDFLLTIFTCHSRGHIYYDNMIYISGRLRDDEDFIRKAVMVNGYHYEHASPRLKRIWREIKSSIMVFIYSN